MKLFEGDGKIDWVLVGEFKHPETAEQMGEVIEHNLGIRTKVDDIYVYTARGRAPEAIVFIEDYMTHMYNMKRTFEENNASNYKAYEEDVHEHELKNPEKEEKQENDENDENED